MDNARRPHIADIDFEGFYRDLFGKEAESRNFINRAEDAPEAKKSAKIILHQAARLVWLGDRINEIAAGRPALQVLFYIITAETVAKLAYRFEGRGQSKTYVHAFFENLCSKTDQDTLPVRFAALQRANQSASPKRWTFFMTFAATWRTVGCTMCSPSPKMIQICLCYLTWGTHRWRPVSP